MKHEIINDLAGLKTQNFEGASLRRCSFTIDDFFPSGERAMSNLEKRVSVRYFKSDSGDLRIDSISFLVLSPDILKISSQRFA